MSPALGLGCLPSQERTAASSLHSPCWETPGPRRAVSEASPSLGRGLGTPTHPSGAQAPIPNVRVSYSLGQQEASLPPRHPLSPGLHALLRPWLSPLSLFFSPIFPLLPPPSRGPCLSGCDGSAWARTTLATRPALKLLISVFVFIGRTITIMGPGKLSNYSYEYS